MNMTPKKALIILGLAMIVVTVLGFVAFASAAEVESIRDSQYEWTCEEADGTLISGHTRQDKAFQSCYNAALASGATYYVRGGTFRVSATGTTAPPPEPDPDPEPPPPDPAPEPQVTFGPVSTLIEYDAAIGALKQNGFTWLARFTLNSVTARNGLFSRDRSGTIEKGHFSLWVENGRLILRHQDSCPNCGGSGLEARLVWDGVEPGVEYTVEVAMVADKYVAMWVDGIFVDSSPNAFGLASNDLPLVLGGLCSSCKSDGSVGPHDPIDGTVYLEIWDAPKPLPEPTASVELRWTNPTQYENGEPIAPGDLTAIRLYQDGTRVAGVDPDVAAYEVTGLYAGRQYCFEATAVAGSEESDKSNQVCMEAP